MRFWPHDWCIEMCVLCWINGIETQNETSTSRSKFCIKRKSFRVTIPSIQRTATLYFHALLVHFFLFVCVLFFFIFKFLFRQSKLFRNFCNLCIRFLFFLYASKQMTKKIHLTIQFKRRIYIAYFEFILIFLSTILLLF